MNLIFFSKFIEVQCMTAVGIHFARDPLRSYLNELQKKIKFIS